ncbi:MAG TPA: hypothetical protein VKV19_08145 [Ktedonobacteraceae bacterium]|nr:hypothetical protein [Ktedonobacteraceae bacterium]
MSIGMICFPGALSTIHPTCVTAAEAVAPINIPDLMAAIIVT